MDEPAVFERLVGALQERGYDPLVHVPGSHEDRYRSVIDACPTHRIAIRGHYPDVVGVTNRDRVFAMEVKGESAIRKGIGQALSYQRGVQRTYLAATADALDRVADVARAKGLGTIAVRESGEIEWEAPNETLDRDLLPDVRGQIAYRRDRRASAGEIAAMSLAQPLNFLAPAIALADGATTREAIAERLRSEYDFEAVDGAVRGATVLGLVDADDELGLTDHGEMAVATLGGSGVHDLADLRAAKDAVRGSTVYEGRPALGTLLRTLFLRHPELRTFVDALSEFEDSTVRFPAILRRLVRRYPNVFLNLFCTERGRERARAFFEQGREDRIHEERAVWTDVVRNNVLFNFVHQLRHAGVLAAKTNGHGGAIDEYDPAEKPWHVRRVEE